LPDFKLPDLGEGMTEAEIDRWLVKEGDEIAEDEPLVEVITDKATAEIPSPYAGTVTRIHVTQGDVVPVGTVLVTIGEGAPPPTDKTSKFTQPPPPPPPAATKEEPDEKDSSDKVKAMPPVRKLARELDVDLTQLRGSGPGGRILREDVEAFADAQRSADAFTAVPTPRAPTDKKAPKRDLGERREPIRGVRRIIAERMSEAHRLVPPVTHVEECDVTELEATKALANERSPDEPRLTFLPFIIKAVCAGLKEHEVLNASIDEAAKEIVYNTHFDIGVAVDTPAGLTVPVIRDADSKRLREIAAEIARLADEARNGTLKAEDLKGGTFTISSPGPFGGLMATPIVFHPQAAILGVHRAGERAVVRDGQIVARKMMNLSITFDHRILDGMTAAKFLLDVVQMLEHPAVLALES
jgi:pyruvate dehydrogenase E2 component (dihydrolipoamide acetyltransferase)